MHDVTIIYAAMKKIGPSGYIESAMVSLAMACYQYVTIVHSLMAL